MSFRCNIYSVAAIYPPIPWESPRGLQAANYQTCLSGSMSTRSLLIECRRRAIMNLSLDKIKTFTNLVVSSVFTQCFSKLHLRSWSWPFLFKDGTGWPKYWTVWFNMRFFFFSFDVTLTSVVLFFFFWGGGISSTWVTISALGILLALELSTDRIRDLRVFIRRI